MKTGTAILIGAGVLAIGGVLIFVLHKPAVQKAPEPKHGDIGADLGGIFQGVGDLANTFIHLFG